MRKFGKYFAVVIAITIVLLANTVNASFIPTPLGKIQSTPELSADKASILQPTQSKSSFNSLSKEMKNQKSESSFLDFWESGAFARDRRFNGAMEQTDFASADEDSMELVIGVNKAHANAYNNLVDVVSRISGEVVNTVSIKGEVIAIVVDAPLTAVSSIVRDVQASGLARYVEPNMKFQAQFIPNDPYWTYQWGPQKIEADYAWDTTTGNHSVIVAVVDTGIDYTHPDLSKNYVALGRDWVNNDDDPLDDNGHGTHCAGIIAAVLNNAVGIAGIANVSIMSEKGLDAYGYGTEDDLANAIIDAVDKGADILSNSWGDYAESTLIYDAIRYAYDNDILVIAAAGNDATSNKLYPAAYNEVVAVTATDSSDYPASFTNFGDWIEVAAPGVDIYSTLPTYYVTLNYPPYSRNLNYDYLSGTSMACPHAAGVAALIWSQFPNATRDWVRAQLRYTGDDLGDPGFDEYYGYGRINTKNAVEQAPPEHDLLIFDWERLPYVKLGELAIFNITVLNFGVSNETDVEVHLLVNGSSIDSTSIALLPRGVSTTVGLSWTPTIKGTYNVTYYVAPVPGETMIQNNLIAEIVTVVAPPPETNWILLATDPDEGMGTNLKSIYGQTYSDTIYFKVEYHRSWTTINDIDTGIFIDADQNASTGLPDGFYPGQDTGIGADYVIVVGLEATEMWKWDPIAEMWDLDNPISLAYLDAPEDSDVFVVGVLFASVETAGIVDCAVTDIPSNWDWMPDSGHFTWIVIQYEHELAVLLETPQYLLPEENSLLNATVYNRGLNNETNVEIQLLINGTEVASETLDELVNGTCYTINYSWTPTAEGIYNITAYAPPVSGENFTLNNVVTRMVSVHYPLINPEPEQYANYVMNYYDSSGHLIGQQGYLNLTYEYYIEPYKIYITAWQKDPSGYIYTGWMIVNTMTRLVESGNIWAGLWYPGWIETDIDIGSTINLMDGTAAVNGTRMLVVGPRAVDCWEIPCSMYGYPYTFWYDKASGLWIGMESTNPYTGEYIEQLLIDTNVPIGVQYENDLGVTLEAPTYLQPGESSMLNATVYNLGLNNESDVEIQLLINGTVVKSETISFLKNGSSHTISYLWAPTIAGKYNITVYAPPVPDENITINNVYSKIIPVQYAPKILAYVQYTDYWQEYPNTLKAIESTFGPNYNVTELWDYTQLDIMIQGKDILLIPEQEYASLSTMQMIGSEWSETLSNFLENGGVIIVCDFVGGSGGTYGILTGAELMSISVANYRTWYTLYLVDPTDPLAEGISSSFIAPDGTISFVTGEANVVVDDGIYPVVIHKEIDRGHVVLLGFDFYSSNADTEQILGNAVALAAYITISTSPSAGSSGTKATVSGTKATANGTVSIYWDDILMGNTTVNNMGDFVYVLTVPENATVEVHKITAVDIATGRTASTSFKVILIALNPTRGSIGTKVTVKGAGFLPESQATVTFNDMLIGYAKVDSFGNFTFIFNIPLSSAEAQTIKALDAEANYASATFTVVDLTPLNVQVDVGTIHFRGELAEFYSQIVLKGIAVNVTNVSAVLYGPNGEVVNYSYPENITLTTTGLYKILYNIPVNASTGTYTLVITASYVTDTVQASGASFKCFLISPTLTNMNAHVVEIRENIATVVIPDLGAIKLNLTAINATIMRIDETSVDIKTALGVIKDVNLADIQLKVTAINGTTATIQSILGPMNGTITSIKNDIATIDLGPLGQIEADISSLKGIQETWIIPQYAIIIIALIAAASSTVSLIFLRRKKPTETK